MIYTLRQFLTLMIVGYCVIATFTVVFAGEEDQGATF
jgi:hypothetical protein